MRSDGQVCKLGIEHSSCICHFLSCAIGDHLVIIIKRSTWPTWNSQDGYK